MKQKFYSKESIMRNLWTDFIIFAHEKLQPGDGIQGPGKWFNLRITKEQKKMLEKHFDELCRKLR